MPLAVAALFLGSVVSGVVAAMSARNRQPGNLQRAVISLAVFSSLCMLVTSVYWVPGAFLAKRLPPVTVPVRPAFAPPPPRPFPVYH